MTPHDQQKQDPFERLLENSSEITTFVNSFTSEKVQVRAFAAVVGSLGLSEAEQRSTVPPLHLVQEAPEEPQLQEDDAEPVRTDSTGSTPRKRRSRSGAKKTFTVPRDLNFAPEGHPSLEEFVAEKQPRNNDENCGGR